MFDQQATISPAKPPQRPDPDVDDPLYLMTLTIPELFLKPIEHILPFNVTKPSKLCSDVLDLLSRWCPCSSSI